MALFTAKFYAKFVFRHKSFDMRQAIYVQFAALFVGGAAQWKITVPVHG